MEDLCNDKNILKTFEIIIKFIRKCDIIKHNDKFTVGNVIYKFDEITRDNVIIKTALETEGYEKIYHIFMNYHKDPYYKLFNYCIKNQKMPSKKDNVILYKYIVEIIDEYKNGKLSKEIINKFERMPFFDWDYTYLKNPIYKDYKNIINNYDVKISESDSKVYKKMLNLTKQDLLPNCISRQVDIIELLKHYNS